MITRLAYWVDQMVHNLDEGVAAYEKVFGWKPAYRIDVPSDGYANAIIPIGSIPGGFTIGGHGVSMTAPLGDNPHPAFDRVLKRRGEGYAVFGVHCEDGDPEIERFKKMGIELKPGRLDCFEEVHTDYWLFEEHTHGLIVEFVAGGGAMEQYFTKGFQKNLIDPEQIPEKGFIIRLGNIVHAVKNLDEALQTYEKIFRWKPSNRWELPDAGVNSAFVRVGSSGIQLVQPTSTKGIVAEIMDEMNEGIAYVILMTDNVKEFVKSMRTKGIETPRLTVGGKPVAWVPRKYTHGILYQVMEPADYFSFFKWGKLY